MTPEFLELLRVLETAQKEREDRSEGLAWIVYERRMMWQAVNRMRHDRGKAPLSMDDVKRVEMMAVGHTDYTQKFAHYCAELVTDRS